jgi:hypothetical protein
LVFGLAGHSNPVDFVDKVGVGSDHKNHEKRNNTEGSKERPHKVPRVLAGFAFGFGSGHALTFFTGRFWSSETGSLAGGFSSHRFMPLGSF